MKSHHLLLVAIIFCLAQCKSPENRNVDYTGTYTIDTGTAAMVQLTSYSTTLVANGTDCTNLRIAVADTLGREIATAEMPVRIYMEGDAKLADADGKVLPFATESTGRPYAECHLSNGTCNLVLTAGKTPGKIKVDSRSGKLWPGSHEIHTLPAEFQNLKPTSGQLATKQFETDKIIGADISWLPEIEAAGKKFFNNGQAIDPIVLLKQHGFNYIRLRIFVDPGNKKGYSPGKDWCGLEQTLLMARRVSDAGMKLLLDFHYSDYWADPQQQYKPERWANLSFAVLQDSVKNYTTRVLFALKMQGTPPAMVQIGNEINHGMLWPDGHMSHPDQLAALLKSGIEGTKVALPDVPVMLHIALGGQNSEAVFWLNNMIARDVRFDVIGLSYYPRWHGTLNDLQANMQDLARRYNKPLNVVEYADFKREVLEIGFSVPDGLGTGACIWEPLNWRSRLFDANGNATELFSVYDEMNKKYVSAKSATQL